MSIPIPIPFIQSPTHISKPMYLLCAALLSALLFGRAEASPLPPVELLVCCGCGLDHAGDGLSWPTAFSTLSSARDALRARLPSQASPAPATITVRGTCILNETLALDARDDGLSIRAAPGFRSQAVGGAPLQASWFVPVTDPAILAQLTPAARASVVELDLTAHGLSPGPGVIGGRGCRTYSEGLPQPHGGNMPIDGINSPPGLEIFVLTASSDDIAALAPLALAHYPNNLSAPTNWSKVEHVISGAPRSLEPDAATLNRTALWENQFLYDPPGSIMVHQYLRVGWADMHWPLVNLSVNKNLTFGACANVSQCAEETVENGNYFYVYNVLAELDTEGEYYINRSSSMLYAWLPPPPPSLVGGAAADAVIAFATVLEAPLLAMNGSSNAAVSGVDFLYGRSVGIVLNQCNNVTIADAQVSAVGLMAINVSDGFAVTISNVSVSNTGNGGVYLYAGDRTTLTPAGHNVVDSTITAYNRYTHCYTPGVVLGGVGCDITRTKIFTAPHQAIFSSGNNHVIDGVEVFDVCRITMDSGAWYAGRDLSYRGNVIKNSYFHDINSFFPGTPILYADDCMSSLTVINTTFANYSGPAAALEGGKDHVFIGNRAEGKGVHAVGKGCSSSIPYLDLVPWNTSEVWLASYPTLVPEVAQNANEPWHLVFVNNSVNACFSSSFVDMSASTILQYNGTDAGNIAINCTA